MSCLEGLCNRVCLGEVQVDNLSNNATTLRGHQMDSRTGSLSIPVNPAWEVNLGSGLVQPIVADYKLLSCIGRGCYKGATISLARHLPSQRMLAIKRIHLEACNIEFNAIVHEIRMHQTLKHKNILESYCTFVNENEIWSVMPLMGYGSCRDLLHAHFNTGIPELTVAFILREVLNGLDYLHKWNIIHRSVQANHILISASGQVCLTGLRYCCSMVVNGVIRQKLHDFPNFVKSLQWASPELLEQNLAGYNTKSDIYSFGITACELANGVVPFADMPLTQMLLEKVEGTIPRLLDSPQHPRSDEESDDIGSVTTTSIRRRSTQESLYYQMPPAVRVMRNFSTSFHKFMKACLQSVATRPSAEQLMLHNFFKQIRKRSCQYMLPELLTPVNPITDTTQIPDEIISVDSLLPKFEWIDIDEWNFSSEPPAERKRVVHLREKFPVENKQRQSTTSFYSDSAPELRGQRESKMSSVGSIKSNESLSGFGSAHKDE